MWLLRRLRDMIVRMAGRLFSLTLLAGGLLLTTACSPPPKEHVSEQFLMDTLVTVKVYGDDPAALQQASAAAFAEMRRIADLADRFPSPGSPACAASDICRINTQAGGEPVTVKPETLEMLTLARRYHRESHGAFAVTIGPVMDLWGFAGETPHLPPPQQLTAALALVDDNRIDIDTAARRVRLTQAGMKLDLGAIAKGYAVERAAAVLRRHGVTNALIDAGGNIRVIGTTPRRQPWRIGVKDPRHGEALIAVVQINDGSAVTSGDYHRYFEADGVRWHHIIDPKTGYPARQARSATVITGDSTVADILSTACFILPPERALSLATSSGAELLLITADGRILHTPGLDERSEIVAGADYRYDHGR